MSISMYDWGEQNKLLSQKYLFKKYQIFFGKLRPYFHKVVISPIEGICSTDILVIEPILPNFLSYCLLHYSSPEIIAYSNQHSGGTRMPRVSWESLENYEIIVPSNDILTQFENKVFPILNSIIQKITENRILEDLKNSLLPKLLSGELNIEQSKMTA